MNYPLPRRLRPSSPEFYRAWFGPSGDDRPEEPEHPHSLRCYLFGCDVPEGDYEPEWRSADGKESQGTVYAINCKRCDREIRPFDRDYPNTSP